MRNPGTVGPASLYGAPMGIEARLRTDRAVARADRDAERASLLGVLLAAIDNGGAVDAAIVPGGVTEVPRRTVDDAAVAEILRGEASELDDAAAALEAAGRPDEASTMRRHASIVRGYLPGR